MQISKIKMQTIQIAFDTSYILALPSGHRFPMEKYELLPRQLFHEGTMDEKHLFRPDMLLDEFALAVHHPEYISRLKNLQLSPREQRVTGFPHTLELVEREFRIMEGTRKCAELAFQTNGVGLNIAGGTHHAFSNRGEGFCMLNDQAIAAQWLLNQQLVHKILIIDLDVHQGNGTAKIFSNEPRVFTFSMHGRNNYPLKKEISDLDVELDDGTSDTVYLYKLQQSLDAILKNFMPEFIFYQSGVDVLQTDKLGKLALSLEGCKKRDEVVFLLAKQLNVPIVCTMGGGYSPEIKIIIEGHANTFRTVFQLFD